MEFSELILKRRSIRAFKEKDIDEKIIKKIMNEINQAPSAGNLQSFRVYIIKNKDIKMELCKAAYDQEYVYKAPVVFVFVADRKRSMKKYGKRGWELYSIQDATIVATFAILSIENSGLGSVWVGAFDDQMVSKILKIGEDMIPVAIIPFGYPDENPEKPERRNVEEIFISYP